MKKLVAIVMAVAMLTTMSLVAFAIDVREKTIFVPTDDFPQNFANVTILPEYKVVDGSYALTTTQFISLVSTAWYGDADYIFNKYQGATFTASYANGETMILAKSVCSSGRSTNTYTVSESMILGFAGRQGEFTLSATFREETQPYSYEVIDWDTSVTKTSNWPVPTYTNSVVKVGQPSVVGTYVQWNFKVPGTSPGNYSLRVES